MAAHNELGRWGEQEACDYLQRKGYCIVARNWKDGHRDLDIVAADEDTLVIVEVKTRKDHSLTEPERAVDWHKVRMLSLAASKFVKLHHIDADIRFDIITVIQTAEGAEINHIKNAFLPAI